MARKPTYEELKQRVKELEKEVSKRKRAQEGLRESEERLKTVVNNVNDVIFQVSPLGFIQYVSPKVKEIYGYNPEELIGKHLRKTTPVSEVPKALEALKRVLSGKTVKNLEINQLDSRGKIIPMEINGTPVKKGGKIIAAQGVMRDISERKRAEEALRKAHDELERRVEERTAELKKANEGLQTEITERKRAEEAQRVSALAWQTLFDAVTDSVFLIDSEGKILLCNKATVNFLGKPINEIVGNTCWELVHATSEPIKGCPIVRMRETRRPESLELPVGDRVFYVATHPILDQDGNIAKAVHIITDITERKRAEIEERKQSQESLRESEEKYKTLTENSLTGIYIHQDGKCVFVNDRFAQIHGYKPDELLGEHYLTLIHPDERTRVKKIGSKRLNGEPAPKHYEARRLRKDGEAVWCATIAVRIEYRGKPAIMGNIVDINEHKLAEQALREREAELKIKTNSLKEMNTALRVLLERRDEDKTELEEKVLVNVKELVVPFLEKVKRSQLDPKQLSYIHILESNLNDIISPFLRNLSTKYVNLTPTEIRVAHLIREGKTTKDIGEVMALSPRTIETHRKNMRKKLGIEKNKGNLRSHLLSLQ